MIATATVLRGERLSVGSRLTAVDVALEPGACLGVLGGPESGKTTLLRALARLEPLSGGRLFWAQRNVTHLPRWRLGKLRRFAALLLPNPYTMFEPRIQVRKFLLGLARDEAAVAAALRAGGLPVAILEARIQQLSGAQRLRLGVVVALLNQSRVILIDDAATRLLPEGWSRVAQDLPRACGAQPGVVLASRHAAALAVCEQLLVLCGGSAVEGGARAAVLDAPAHPYTRQLLQQPQTGAEASAGCGFAAQCALARPICAEQSPPLTPLAPDHWVRCHAVVSG